MTSLDTSRIAVTRNIAGALATVYIRNRDTTASYTFDVVAAQIRYVDESETNPFPSRKADLSFAAVDHLLTIVNLILLACPRGKLGGDYARLQVTVADALEDLLATYLAHWES